MNQGPPEMYYPPHMSTGQPQAPQTVTSGPMSHYPHSQPPLLQPGPQYSNATNSYSQYSYANGITSPPSASVSGNMGNSQPVLPLPGVNGQAGMPPAPYSFDTTGQNPPPGMKPRVTATLWEDEGSLCFQVEARGICVARREDNHMINGTKLLNVAGMTRGRRDGILKSEKIRHVVKIGPMHLKGVWIPYERALDFANKEKITELLYPLFVHNIGALLYHPTNQNRTSQVMAAAERRKAEQSQMRTPPAGLPSIQQHQSHSMALPGPQPSLPSNNMGRPSLDRAHTFPTPPTSASSVMASMGSSDNFGWQGQALNGSQSTNSMNMETGLNTARSMPNTPATTPPGSMQPYQPGAHAYDNSRQLYNPPSTQQSPYHNANGSQERLYSQNNPYPKSEMGPPTSRPGASAAPGEHHDSKPANGVLPSENTTQAHNGEEEGDHEHDPEYTHDNGGYDGNRPSYNYTAPGVGALTGDNNINPEMTGSPNHQGHSGRATPRSAAPQQSYYPQNTGYGTPPRVQPPTSNLYSVMSNDRPQTNGASGNDVYAPPADMGNSMQNGYAPHPPVLNGSIGAMKRGRDDDDDLPRPGGDGHGAMAGLDLKRRKTMESSVPAPTYDAMSRPTSAISGGPRR